MAVKMSKGRRVVVRQRVDHTMWSTCAAARRFMGFPFLLGYLVVSIQAGFAAGDDPHTRATLAGVQGVQVVVEAIDPDVARRGLNRVQLQTDIELWLRQAGIEVWPREEGGVHSGRPSLHVRVATAKEPRSGRYAINVSVELQQAMFLGHNPTLMVIAPTWSMAGIGILTAKHIPALRADIRTYVDDFIRDYLAANSAPSPPPAPPPLPGPRAQHQASWRRGDR